MKRTFLYLLIVFLLIITTGCSKNNELVGSWFYEEYSTGAVMERTTGMLWTFRKDGTCAFRQWGSGNYDEVKCSYEIEDSYLKVKMMGSSNRSDSYSYLYEMINKYKMSYTISPTGKMMTLSFVDGSDSSEWKSFKSTFKEYYCNPDYQYHSEVLNISAGCRLPGYVQTKLCDNLSEW